MANPLQISNLLVASMIGIAAFAIEESIMHWYAAEMKKENQST
jgi:hypothetical protein